MKRPDNSKNDKDPSKRLRQEQQVAFNEDTLEIRALLHAHGENEPDPDPDPDAEPCVNASGAQADARGNGDQSLNESDHVGNNDNGLGGNLNMSRNGGNHDLRVEREIEVNESMNILDGAVARDRRVPQAPLNGNGGRAIAQFITSSDEEGDGDSDTERAWLSAPAGPARLRSRVGDDFQASLPNATSK